MRRERIAAIRSISHLAGFRIAMNPHTSLAPMNDETLLLTHARRYFRAAAECQDLRKMAVLVDLGLDYLKLAARRNGSGGSPGFLKSKNPADVPTSDAGADS